MNHFLLPDLGEGLTEATIVSWHVAVGDEVALNQALAEVETAKALVELPSPRAGRIGTLHAAEGETLAVGAPLIGFADTPAASPDDAGSDAAPDGAGPDGAGSDAAPDDAAPDDAAPDGAGPGDAGSDSAGSDAAAPAGAASGDAAPAGAAPHGAPAPDGTPAGRPRRQQVLVGYGPVLPGTDRPRRRPRSFPTTPYVGRTEEEARHERPAAMPPVRRRARDLGVDLAAVHGSGPGGRILRADVEASAGRDPHGTRSSTLVPLTGLRRETARAMTDSAFTAPHASVHVTIDVTDTLELLDRGGRDGRRSSFLAAVCRAILPAAARTPAANARFDAEAGRIEQFAEVVLGIAVATDRGLVVAALDGSGDADGAGLTERIARAASRARAGALTPAELTGSTLTVTNVGVFGVHGGTPILNPGQSTILAVGALRTQPWEHRGEVALRTVVTLTLSFDHRVLDGAEASAFLMDVAEVLADPATLLVR
ncbi:dihydrolipoamide acetyltransferase family protein [Brachybacterium sp. AOP43-C2-M15]|uniref:dihydrolipoamide acetyltransferase family protein n=1 Tax=Brachybacterium sp. AOP43-C2-M15 TaxID=3457661 RepID=UPI0040334CEC